ncbi:MAG: DUF4282 domain-containing protein [Firmicutes bacterium]|nr:DUF4282 domain-containing protein [Bacillota bacterium]
MPAYMYSRVSGLGVFLVIAFILAIAACVAAYFIFFSPRSRFRFTGFAEWLHEFLNFRKLIVTDILKILYVFALTFCTLCGLFALFAVSALSGLLIIILGNVCVRIFYELIIVIFSIHSNIAELNEKAGKKSGPEPDPGVPAAQAVETATVTLAVDPAATEKSER